MTKASITQLALVTCLALSTAGCVQTAFIATSPGTYAARPANCSLEIFSTALPDRDYIEVGIIEGEGNFWKADLEDILPKIRERACEVGGQGLVLLDTDSYASGEEGVDVQVTRATVIRWL